MAQSKISDFTAALRGVQLIGRAFLPHELRRTTAKYDRNFEKLAENVEKSAQTATNSAAKILSNQNVPRSTDDAQKLAQEVIERSKMVAVGAQKWARLMQKGVLPGSGGRTKDKFWDSAEEFPTKEEEVFESFRPDGTGSKKTDFDFNTSDFDRAIEQTLHSEAKSVDKEATTLGSKTADGSVVDKAVKTILEQEAVKQQVSIPKSAKTKSTYRLTKERPQLSELARESSVPSSRIGRFWTFGNMAVGLGLGAAAEATKRSLGLSKVDQSAADSLLGQSNPFLSDANAERIVKTLCRVRGAALKLGQMLSIQDSSLVSPQLQKIFDRVRDSADFMPTKQVLKVLSSELGDDWRDKVSEFDEKPFAAASIGQVHRAVLLDGREVAMKIQYPGVAQSINSDINNLVSILNLANLVPVQMYLEKFIRVARHELSMECDYIHEKEASRKFREMLKDDNDIYIPEVVDDLTTKQVLTSELIFGRPLDKCQDLPQDTRNWVGSKILELCVRELFEFRYMQTDPNFANFFYSQTDSGENQLILLDFGASRPYAKKFVDLYMRIIHAAALQDRHSILQFSTDIGFLTGYETKLMKDAHCDAVLILGEALASEGKFDFGAQDTIRRVQRLIPVMVEHRLTPPPEEVYSLHRKLAGAFLLCTKLSAVCECSPIFNKIYDNYEFGDIENDIADDYMPK